MIAVIEARDYRCLRSVRQPLGPLQLQVGPKGTGKSTLLDVVRLLSRLTTDRLQAAISDAQALLATHSPLLKNVGTRHCSDPASLEFETTLQRSSPAA